VISIRRPFGARGILCAALLATSVLVHAGTLPFFSGHVTDSQGNPVVGATVQAGYIGFLAGWYFATDGQGTTDQQGAYAITVLDSANLGGQYVLVVQASGYVLTVYPNLYCTDNTCLENPSLPVTAPQSIIDFTLLRSASISGNVTRTDTNTPVANAQLDARTTTTGYIGYGPELNTDASGNYTFNDLPPGTYVLSIQPTLPPLLKQTFSQHDYDDTLNPIYDAITLQEGQNFTGADFPLHLGSTISGTLTSTIDSDSVSAYVTVARIDPNAVSGYVFVSGSTGAYMTDLLAPGSFYVQFGKDDDYFPLFYKQTSDEAQAQIVSLSLGQQLTEIDAQLTPVRTISGVVTDATTTAPMQGVAVHVGTYSGFIFQILSDQADAVTDASGHYLLQGLDSETDPEYYVWVDQARGYIDQFYPMATPCCNNPVSAGATALSLGDTENKTGVNLALLAGAYASGRVYDPDTNYAAAGFSVQVLDNAGDMLQSANTDASGTYWTPSVPTGSYYLRLSLSGSYFFYPNYQCTYVDCQLSSAQLQNFGKVQEYPNLDFAIPHLDLIFRGGFDQ
jgi:carboxypeptidase family protein